MNTYLIAGKQGMIAKNVCAPIIITFELDFKYGIIIVRGKAGR
ncbi:MULTISPECIES: hypothetical protein [Peribacillus]